MTMIKKLKSIVLSVLAGGALLMPAMVPATALAADPVNISGNLCGGVNVSTTASGECNNTNADTTVSNILKTVINLFSIIVGVIAVVMIIVGGVKYITSGGESSNVTGAKNTILYAVIGLIVVALAQILVRFVLSKVNTAAGGSL